MRTSSCAHLSAKCRNNCGADEQMFIADDVDLHYSLAEGNYGRTGEVNICTVSFCGSWRKFLKESRARKMSVGP